MQKLSSTEAELKKKELLIKKRVFIQYQKRNDESSDLITTTHISTRELS